MMTQQFAPDRRFRLPTELDSPQGKLVYLYLDATGGATLEDLKGTLSMRKIAILSVLRSLSSQELIERDGDEYVPIA
ncbi:MarR family transcriptional regulator [Halosolutus gelatinilyticus]|uniref:MarR family transcriptional regulator n=1 Tax=Halosolutus gelatinilyticus TaxID=2931975 RepID=UPI001FF6A7C2|nr:MarR family transcriptional regulator [Halosolutus gelatinilyticus]